MIAISRLQEKYGAEITVVILMCRVFAGTMSMAELQNFIDTNTIDWAAFHKLISAHRIRPVVNRTLASLRIPDGVISALQAETTQVALHNFEHYREQQQILSALQNADVLAVPYKGSVYSQQFYGDLSLRESSDLDFLIPNDIATADKLNIVMLQQGYAAASYIPLKFRSFYLTHMRECKYIFSENGMRKFLTEFHLSLNDSYFETVTPITNKYFFDHLVADRNGMHALSATAHAVALITHHGIREQWSNLKKIMDIAMATRNDEVDWQAIDALATEAGFSKVLHIGLTVINDVIGVVPAGLQVHTTDTTPWLDNLLSTSVKPIDRTWRYNFLLRLKAKDSVADRLRQLMAYAGYATYPALADYIFLPLPRPFFFLYVFIKPLRKLMTANPS
jgi:hypothetical protein